MKLLIPFLFLSLAAGAQHVEMSVGAGVSANSRPRPLTPYSGDRAMISPVYFATKMKFNARGIWLGMGVDVQQLRILDERPVWNSGQKVGTARVITELATPSVNIYTLVEKHFELSILDINTGFIAGGSIAANEGAQKEGRYRYPAGDGFILGAVVGAGVSSHRLGVRLEVSPRYQDFTYNEDRLFHKFFSVVSYPVTANIFLHF